MAADGTGLSPGRSVLSMMRLDAWWLDSQVEDLYRHKISIDQLEVQGACPLNATPPNAAGAAAAYGGGWARSTGGDDGGGEGEGGPPPHGTDAGAAAASSGPPMAGARQHGEAGPLTEEQGEGPPLLVGGGSGLGGGFNGAAGDDAAGGAFDQLGFRRSPSFFFPEAPAPLATDFNVLRFHQRVIGAARPEQVMAGLLLPPAVCGGLQTPQLPPPGQGPPRV